MTLVFSIHLMIHICSMIYRWNDLLVIPFLDKNSIVNTVNSRRFCSSHQATKVAVFSFRIDVDLSLERNYLPLPLFYVLLLFLRYIFQYLISRLFAIFYLILHVVLVSARIFRIMDSSPCEFECSVIGDWEPLWFGSSIWLVILVSIVLLNFKSFRNLIKSAQGKLLIFLYPWHEWVWVFFCIIIIS